MSCNPTLTLGLRSYHFPILWMRNLRLREVSNHQGCAVCDRQSVVSLGQSAVLPPQTQELSLKSPWKYGRYGVLQGWFSVICDFIDSVPFLVSREPSCSGV